MQKILLNISNHQLQNILEDMDMLDDNGNCPYTAEEILKAGMEYAVNKNCEWLRNNWRKYVYKDIDGIICFGHWENDLKKVTEENNPYK